MHGVNRSICCLLLSSLAVFASVPPSEKIARNHQIVARQLLPSLSATSSTASRTDTTTTTTAPASTSITSALTSASAPDSSSSTTSSPSLSPSSTSEITQGPSTSVGVSTDAEGRVSTSTEIVTPSASNTSLTPTQTSSSNNDSSSSLGTGSIIGLSVAGGIALIGILGFLVWKLTRKRFSDFDDNEAIKWPELNAQGGDSHALPVHSTGRAGFDTGSEIDINSVAPDPYAVPPLPHLNPNQPYRDDPSAASYYDPYRGPNPNAFNDTESMDVPTGPGWSNAEAIPMTQMSRARSPGPQVAYDAGAAGRRSPGPQAAYGPGGYVDDRAISPGPNVGLGGMPPSGRRSPGPQAAYEPFNNATR